MAKILIAEDERPISELVKRNLMLVGHTAAQAFDGPCALEMAGAERFDLVLLDVMLPGCSGFEGTAGPGAARHFRYGEEQPFQPFAGAGPWRRRLHREAL